MTETKEKTRFPNQYQIERYLSMNDNQKANYLIGLLERGNWHDYWALNINFLGDVQTKVKKHHEPT